MFRLGTRPDRKRRSSPPEASTSSFSPLSVETALGTSLMFSTRRSAVITTVSSWFFSAGFASWARAAERGQAVRARPMAKFSA